LWRATEQKDLTESGEPTSKLFYRFATKNIYRNVILVERKHLTSESEAVCIPKPFTSLSAIWRILRECVFAQIFEN